MKKSLNIVKRELAHIWHPCTQMKDHEKFPPIEIRSAKGAFLYTADGKKIIDGISSWWCKSLGHRHPQISRAVKKQITAFEHIIPAGTVQKPLVELSEMLSSFIPKLNKVFYSDSGSSAVEIAAKMALQFHAQRGSNERILFASLQNGYHGETSLALSLGDCALYSSPFLPILQKTFKITPTYVNDKLSPLWDKIPDNDWENIEKSLNENANRLAAVVFEPILQGAGGMLIYSKNFLQRLSKWAKKNNILLIADEIMTGFHRTGPVFASMHAGIVPDFICLSKGLTAGWGAMSAVLTRQEIFDAFYDDYSTGKAFLHSSTYTGNAICAAAAVQALKIYEKGKFDKKISERECEIRNAIEYLARESDSLINLRSIGFVAAGDIVNPKTAKAYPKELRVGFNFYQNAVRKGAFLRNLGDTIYFMPPLNTAPSIIRNLAKIATLALRETISKTSKSKHT